jgi:hypothetical protein
MTTNLKPQPLIGAFYQCYKQPKAFLDVLGHFRAVYPDATIVAISDGGFDYAEAARHFNCDYHHGEHGVPGAGTIFNDKNALIQWFTRLLETAQRIKEDYILLLEDDVQVLKPVSGLSFDLNGVNKREKLGRKLTDFLKTKNPSIPFGTVNYFYGGCGGTIIKKEFLLQRIRTIENIIRAIDDIGKYTVEPHSTRYASDYYLTAIILYYGGSIGNYKGFCERWRTIYPFRRYILKNIEVVHQDKGLYDKALTVDERKLFGPVNLE